jgi:hypothetical protein
MWRRSRAGAGAPSARAAPTYSVSRRARTEPRTIRVTAGIPQIPTAIVVLRLPGPSAATIASASSRYGKARRISIPRIIRESSQPPLNPASMPSTRPPATAIVAESTPTSSATREPDHAREAARLRRPQDVLAAGARAARQASNGM